MPIFEYSEGSVSPALFTGTASSAEEIRGLVEEFDDLHTKGSELAQSIVEGSDQLGGGDQLGACEELEGKVQRAFNRAEKWIEWAQARYSGSFTRNAFKYDDWLLHGKGIIKDNEEIQELRAIARKGAKLSQSYAAISDEYDGLKAAIEDKESRSKPVTRRDQHRLDACDTEIQEKEREIIALYDEAYTQLKKVQEKLKRLEAFFFGGQIQKVDGNGVLQFETPTALTTKKKPIMVEWDGILVQQQQRGMGSRLTWRQLILSGNMGNLSGDRRHTIGTKDLQVRLDRLENGSYLKDAPQNGADVKVAPGHQHTMPAAQARALQDEFRAILTTVVRLGEADLRLMDSTLESNFFKNLSYKDQSEMLSSAIKVAARYGKQEHLDRLLNLYRPKGAAQEAHAEKQETLQQALIVASKRSLEGLSDDEQGRQATLIVGLLGQMNITRAAFRTDEMNVKPLYDAFLSAAERGNSKVVEVLLDTAPFDGMFAADSEYYSIARLTKKLMRKNALQVIPIIMQKKSNCFSDRLLVRVFIKIAENGDHELLKKAHNALGQMTGFLEAGDIAPVAVRGRFDYRYGGDAGGQYYGREAIFNPIPGPGGWTHRVRRKGQRDKVPVGLGEIILRKSRKSPDANQFAMAMVADKGRYIVPSDALTRVRMRALKAGEGGFAAIISEEAPFNQVGGRLKMVEIFKAAITSGSKDFIDKFMAKTPLEQQGILPVANLTTKDICELIEECANVPSLNFHAFINYLLVGAGTIRSVQPLGAHWLPVAGLHASNPIQFLNGVVGVNPDGETKVAVGKLLCTLAKAKEARSSALLRQVLQNPTFKLCLEFSPIVVGAAEPQHVDVPSAIKLALENGCSEKVQLLLDARASRFIAGAGAGVCQDTSEAFKLMTKEQMEECFVKAVDRAIEGSPREVSQGYAEMRECLYLLIGTGRMHEDSLLYSGAPSPEQQANRVIFPNLDARGEIRQEKIRADKSVGEAMLAFVKKGHKDPQTIKLFVQGVPTEHRGNGQLTRVQDPRLWVGGAVNDDQHGKYTQYFYIWDKQNMREGVDFLSNGKITEILEASIAHFNDPVLSEVMGSTRYTDSRYQGRRHMQDYEGRTHNPLDARGGQVDSYSLTGVDKGKVLFKACESGNKTAVARVIYNASEADVDYLLTNRRGSIAKLPDGSFRDPYVMEDALLAAAKNSNHRKYARDYTYCFLILWDARGRSLCANSTTLGYEMERQGRFFSKEVLAALTSSQDGLGGIAGRFAGVVRSNLGNIGTYLNH